jgi:tetratricopeptide (TPR) repeat protein
MTVEKSGPLGGRFALLPWLLGAAGLLLYLTTLNPWVSLLSLGTVGRVLEWSGPPAPGQPLTSAVLYVFRALPASWVPLGLNLFTALCAAAVLVLLARSVALLPHDFGPEDPFQKKTNAAPLATPTAWMPPALAVSMCGLQLSFWEHATSFTGEMLDLVLIAYIIRCLLEFRLSQEQHWLSRCAFAYAAGMANNWALIGYSPLFLLVLLRAKGLGPFLERRFLVRMGLWGLAGLSLYLFLPALQSFSSEVHSGFWAALKAHLRAQRTALGDLRNPSFRMLALASLLPLLVLSIRWKSHTVQFGDDSRLGVFLTKATGHFVHGLLFAASLWLALDPSFSPRHFGMGVPMLSCYYISALVAGYCAGYFLLFGSGEARGQLIGEGGIRGVKMGNTDASTVARGASTVAVGGVWFLIGALPLVLAERNLGQIRLTNGRFVREFARGLYADLPEGKSVVLSEESWQRLLLGVEVRAHGRKKEALLLDSLALFSPDYQKAMAVRFKSRWPAGFSTNGLAAVDTREMQDLVSAFAAREPVIYLHPSSGLFFERFTARPKGEIYYLVPRRPGGPGESESESQRLDQNELVWKERWSSSLRDLAARSRGAAQPGPDWARGLRAVLRLVPEQNLTASLLASAYSKSLDYRGVQLQRVGRWPEAGIWFGRALELNPENLAAQINAAYNQRYQGGDKTRLDAPQLRQQFQELFERYQDWREVLNDHGPVDEPTFLFRTGRVLEAAGFPRQAAAEFGRGAELAPEWPVPKLWLARCRLELGDFAGALELTERMQVSSPPKTGAGRADLLYYRATALRGLGRTNEASACIEGFLRDYPEQPGALSTAAELYEQSREWQPELALLEGWLERDPNNPKLLARKGFAELQLGKYETAIATLNRALALAPAENEVRLHRAIACFRAGQLDAAREDYQELLKTEGYSQNALFGLGTIAWRRQDTNAAVQFYQQYLTNTIAQSAQYAVAAERLRQLKQE